MESLNKNPKFISLLHQYVKKGKLLFISSFSLTIFTPNVSHLYFLCPPPPPPSFFSIFLYMSHLLLFYVLSLSTWITSGLIGLFFLDFSS